MKMKKILVLLLVLAIVSPLFAGGRGQADGTPAPRPQVLSLATATLGGTYYIVGAALGEAITKRVPHLTVNAIISGGSTGNPLMLHRDEAELGITNYFSAWNAISGNAPFNKKIPIAGICPLQYSTLHIMVMGNRNDINTLADLKGKKVNLGPAGSGGALFFRDMLHAWKLTEADFNFSFLSFNEGTEALRDGRVDCNIPNGAAPLETVSSLAAMSSVKLISLEADRMKEVNKNNPYYDMGVIPGGTYKGIDKDVHTGGIQDVLIVRQDMDEQTAYLITKAIYESLADLRKVHPSLSNMKFDGYNNSLVPLHPGALRFYKEKNIPIQ